MKKIIIASNIILQIDRSIIWQVTYNITFYARSGVGRLMIED